eukprot:m.22809 g.22809  ORF g.22809 m.22809 type:complete len:437 (-) comp3803_c0_seq1:132-1442(-)
MPPRPPSRTSRPSCAVGADALAGSGSRRFDRDARTASDSINLATSLGAMSNSFFSRLRRFDAYPKTLEDFREKTFSGAAVSIVAAVLMLALFASEINYFLTTEVQPELFVDTSRNEKMRINVDVMFHHLPCGYLSIDVMDISGEQQLDVDHNLFKQRLDRFGNPIHEGEEKTDLGETKAVAVIQSLNSTLDPARCESCYGAETPESPCCNTCEEVREAYRRRGWAMNSADGVIQCEREGWTQKMKEQSEEGCIVYGYLLVNKVAGNFHFAPGKSFQQHNIHIHDMQHLGRSLFNMSHVIRRLSFGHEYPGLVNPLDGHAEISDKPASAMYQYFVKVVPTRYKKASGQTISTNQYSVTTHTRFINTAFGEQGLPGVFVMFDMSPILVSLTESRRSFMHFLTSVCAIVGGIFTVAGMIDSIIHHSLRTWRKNQLGKQG